MECCGFSFSPGPFFSVGLQHNGGRFPPPTPSCHFSLSSHVSHSLSTSSLIRRPTLPSVYLALLISRSLPLYLLTLIPVSSRFFPFSRLSSQSQTLSAIVSLRRSFFKVPSSPVASGLRVLNDFISVNNCEPEVVKRRFV